MPLIGLADLLSRDHEVRGFGDLEEGVDCGCRAGARVVLTHSPRARVRSADRSIISTFERPYLRGRPERIFVSVDQSTGRSTLSFAPGDIAAPVQLENDPKGQEGLAHAREIAAAYPGAVVVGPHFHAAPGKPRNRRGRR